MIGSFHGQARRDMGIRGWGLGPRNGVKVDYRNNKAWQACDDLVAVYQATQIYPKHEQYGLVSQMRRAAVSAAANIAEYSVSLRGRAAPEAIS